MNTYLSKIIISMILILPTTVQSQQLCFDPANDNRYEVMEVCHDFGILDFNNDQHQDILVSGGSMVSVHLGNGDGTFQPYETTSPGTNQHIELVDFDNDTDLDLYSYGSGNLVAGRNNGDGTMEWLGYLGIALVDGVFSEMAVGDVTGDGRADIIVNDSGDDKLHVFEMDVFGVPVSTFSIDTPDQPYGPAVADLNNDDVMDIVCALGSSENIAIYLANGGTSFTEILTEAGPSTPYGYSKVAIVNLDNDDDNDIAVSAAAMMYVIMNEGGGAFSAPSDVFMGTYCSGFKTGDWDDDNDLDVAWANNSNGGITVNLNNGDGTFPAAGFSLFSSNGSAVELATEDFDEDGKPDIIVANGFDGNFAFLHGWGDGHFGTRSLLTPGNSAGFTSGDFDNDGDEDIISTNQGTTESSQLAIHLNNGDGSFANTTFIPNMNGSGECASGDFNEDENLDIATHSPYGYIVHFGNGDGSFQPWETFETNNPNEGGDRTCTVGDFNNDGHLDIAGSRPGSNTVSIILGDGTGTFESPILLAGSGYPRTIMANDFNSDNLDELIVCSNTTDEVWVYFSQGDGVFSNPLILSTPGQPEGLTAFDADEDNFSDLIVGAPNLNKIYVFPSNNDGTFAVPIQLDVPTGSGMTRLAHGDINNDDHQDIVAALYQEDASGVFFGNGDGTFQSAIVYDVDQAPTQILVSDFNNDNAVDIATLNSASNNISVVLNNAAFITADGELAICEGESVVLTASAGYAYEWSSGETTPSISVSENGEFYCSITNQAGDCTLITPAVNVEVFGGLVVTLDLDSTLVCAENGSFFLSGGQPFGGLYTGTGVTANVFDPSNLSEGSYTITYSYADIGECTVGSATDEIVVDVCSNIDELIKSFKVFPALASDNLTIAGIAPFDYQVFDIHGRLIIKQSSTSSISNLEVDKFSPGIYIMNIQTGDAQTTLRFEKQ